MRRHLTVEEAESASRRGGSVGVWLGPSEPVADGPTVAWVEIAPPDRHEHRVTVRWCRAMDALEEGARPVSLIATQRGTIFSTRVDGTVMACAGCASSRASEVVVGRTRRPSSLRRSPHGVTWLSRAGNRVGRRS